jgi:hypothetical protein
VRLNPVPLLHDSEQIGEGLEMERDPSSAGQISITYPLGRAMACNDL